MKENIQIIVKRSHIELLNYELGDYMSIEQTFSFYRPVTHDFAYCGMNYDEENQILYLPRGIDVWWLESKLDKTAQYDNSMTKYKPIDDIKLILPPRDDIQKQALRFMVGVGEYQSNQNKSQLCLNLNTGKGKTYVSIATICYFQIKTILIMYSTYYIEQWRDCILEYTNLKSKDIKIINGSAGINRLLNKGKDDASIYLVTHSTLERYGTTYGWEKIGELFDILGIGIKIYDEAHQNFDNITLIDSYTNVYKTFYVTASPAKSSEEENKIYMLYFKNVPAISLFNEEEDPHTKYIAIKFTSNPNIFDIREMKNQYGLDRNKYMNWLVNKDEYYQLLRVILDLAMKCNGKCLIYIGTNEAIKITYNWIRWQYPQLADDVGIFTTLVSAEEKYNNKDKKIILSTTKSAGAAVDISGLKMTVVLNEPFKSQVITQQTIGRTRDDDTFYIDCVDIGFKKLVQFYNYKQPVVNKYCTENELIRLNRTELEERAYKIMMSQPHIDLIEPIEVNQLLTRIE